MYKPIEYSYQVSKNVFAGEHPLFDIYKRSIKGNIPTLLARYKSTRRPMSCPNKFVVV